MPDDTTPGATPGAGAGATPPVAQGDPGAGPGDGTSTDDRAAANRADALARVARERDEARAELRTLKEKDLPEAERRQRRVAELEAAEKGWSTERQDLRMEIQAIRIAAKLDFFDAEDALGWLARNRAKVEFDSDGNPTNIERLLKDLVKENPRYLKATAQPRGSAEGGARGTGTGVMDMNAALRRAAGRG